MDCLFCKIVAGEIPSKRVLETEEFVAFHDVHPQAKVHVLVVPRKHVAALTSAFPDRGDPDADGGVQLVGKLMKTGVEVARKLGLEAGGFRSVINTGPDGGQTVFHLHLHVIGGEKLRGGMA